MALGAFDEALFHALNGAGNPFLDPFAIALGVVGLLPFALLWAVPLWLGSRRADAVDLVALLLLDGALVLVLKAALQVPRPEGVLLAIPLDDVSDFAFPSGHTSRAFAAALLLGLRLPDRRWAVVLYAYAVAMGLSRVYAGAHWPSDVAAGAILGTAWSLAFVRLSRVPAYASLRDRLLARLSRG